MVTTPHMPKSKATTPTSLNNGRLMVRRESALRLVDAGRTPDVVGRRLGIPEHAVRAYMAHRTMGKY